MRSSTDFHQLIFHQSHPQLASHEIFFIGRPIAFLLSPLLFLLYKSSFFLSLWNVGKKIPGFSSSAGQRAWIPCLNTSFVSENLSKWSFPCFLHLLSLLHPLTTHLLTVQTKKSTKKTLVCWSAHGSPGLQRRFCFQVHGAMHCGGKQGLSELSLYGRSVKIVPSPTQGILTIETCICTEIGTYISL